MWLLNDLNVSARLALAARFVDSFAEVLILIFMLLLTTVALAYSSAMGSSKDSIIFNLGQIPEGSEVWSILTDIALYIQEESEDSDEKERKMIACLDAQLNRVGKWWKQTKHVCRSL